MMNRMGKMLVVLLGLAMGTAWAEDTVRAELGRPLQAAQELIKSKKFRDALEKLHEADSVSGKSVYETLVVEQLRLVAATSAGEGAVAAKAFDALAATGRLSAGDQPRYILAVANSFYQSKEYANAALWAQRYQAAGGADPQVETLILQSHYLAEDYASVVKDVQGIERPTEAQLQILASSYLKQGDTGNYALTLERLVTVNPKDEYWADLIHRVTTRPGFADRLGLDVGRLELAQGRLKTADQYVEQAELALQAGFPAEAKTILDQGFAKGLLGIGADADRHRRLQEAAAKGAAKDLSTLSKEEADAEAAKDGNGLVAAGQNYLANGQAAKAAQLIQKGLEIGGVKRPEDARLHLGLALLRAGDKAKAADVFHAVRGTDGTAELARLWLAQISRS